MPRAESRRKHFCFTKFLLDGEEKNVSEYFSDESRTLLQYAVWQLEQCPETGRLHIQGYAEFKNQYRFSRAKVLLGGGQVHLEARNGTRDSAREYCRKPESRLAGPWEFGSFSFGEQGKRSDLLMVAERIQSGISLNLVVNEFPVQYIRYTRGCEALYRRVQQARNRSWREVTCLVYFGASGAGKTRRAIEESKQDFYILDQGERVWFDGYGGESTLIIDDFYGWIKYGMLLRILDGHPYRGEIKGGFIWANWTSVIITSNKPPPEWYATGLTPALRRRITRVMEFHIEGEPTEFLLN
ncbi:replication-associated protein [Crucivirus-482]|nr:replication-associated protein [Crucivirus-482]